MGVGHFGERGARSWETLASGESGFAQVKEAAAGVAEGGGDEVAGASVAEFEAALERGG